ncbi:swa2p [Saccharomyces arboricola H-6]|uniref:Swa2p n=1 Tax=Saccharomyces arboricola (strain H-6 / AS 2.3317 / CBS 10644) TaxID=1160507 RepID=J8Q0V5_SACAR|nr:swa2p [Saccharomyces arboricola H-6]
MADPFAHLLTSLKNNGSVAESRETTPQSNEFPSAPDSVVTNVTTTDKGNKRGPYSASASPLIPSSKVSFSTAPLVPSNGNSNSNSANNTPSPAPTKIDDDFNELFGSDIMDERGEPQQLDKDYGNNDVRDGDLVDEVEDMEIAKLMSLGLSIERATELYKDDVTYESYLEALKSKHRKEKDRTARHRPNDIKVRKAGLFNNAGSENNNLFNIATGFFNKGKELVDQWTSFPAEENNRLNTHMNVEDDFNDHDLSLESNSYDGPLVKKSVQEEDLLGGDNPDEDLLTDFETNMDVTKRTTNDTTPSPPYPDILIEEEPRKEESSREDNLLDFSTDNSTKIKSAENSTLFDESCRTSSVIPISDIELSGYNEFRAKGTILFKSGDYVHSLQEYEKSLNSLPSRHPLKIIAISNIIASQLKVGDYSKSIEYSDIALELFPPTKANWNNMISKSDPERSFNDIWPKLMIRRAESFEHLENFKNALETYQELINRNFFDDKIMQGKRRCQDFIKPHPVRKPNPIKKTTTTTPVTKKSTPNAPLVFPDNASKVKEKEKELENARLALYDKVFERISSWKNGKDDDIRHLLANLSDLLTWCNWKDVSVQDLVMPKKVKLTYMKAVAKTHPDKIPESLSLENKMVAENVFSTLSIAWDKFKQQNDIN